MSTLHLTPSGDPQSPIGWCRLWRKGRREGRRGSKGGTEGGREEKHSHTFLNAGFLKIGKCYMMNILLYTADKLTEISCSAHAKPYDLCKLLVSCKHS